MRGDKYYRKKVRVNSYASQEIGMMFSGMGRGCVSVLSRMVRVILTKQRFEGFAVAGRGGAGVVVNKKGI